MKMCAKSLYPRLAVLVVGSVLTASVGCSRIVLRPRAGPVFWISDCANRVFATNAVDKSGQGVFDDRAKMITLTGAGGETVAFQIVFPAQDVTWPIRLQMTPFRLVRLGRTGQEKVIDQIGPEAVRFYRVANVLVRTYDALYARHVNSPAIPAGFPDALVPLGIDSAGRADLRLDAGQATVVWVELQLPMGMPRGTYAANLSAGTEYASTVLPVVLESWGFDLPKPAVSIFAILDVARVWQLNDLGRVRNSQVLVLSGQTSRLDDLCRLVGKYVRLISDHGLQVWPGAMYAKIGGRPEAETIDWSGYRAVAEAFTEASGGPYPFWPIPVSLRYPPPARFGRYDTPTYRSLVSRYIDEFYDTFVPTGIFSQAVAIFGWPDDRIVTESKQRSWTALAEAVREAHVDLSLVNPFIPSDLRLFGLSDFVPAAVGEHVNVYCPLGSFWEPGLMTELKDAGKSIWWRPGLAPAVPDLAVTKPYHSARAIPWSAWRYGADGVVIPDVIGRVGRRSPGKVVEVGSSKHWLVYPGEWFGSSNPVPTIRLKMLHRGLQDIAYLKALAGEDGNQLADFLARRLVRFAHLDALDGSLWSVRTDGLCEDFRAWPMARIIAGLARAGHRSRSRAEVPTADYDMKVLKQQFRQLSDMMVLQCQGIKASRTQAKDTGREAIKWTYQLAVRNYTARPLTGTLTFGTLPGEFDAVTDRVKITQLDWAFPFHARLEAVSESSSVGLFGSRVQNVVLHREVGEQIVLPCRVTALSAARLDRAIGVDGEFDDWPDPSGPVAGNFWRTVRDGAGAAANSPLSRRAAMWQTVVQVAHDGHDLYFAFRCRQPRQALRRLYTNHLAVSAGAAWGEDLVEVLMDPDNRRSFDPRDVYHVIVKANGAVICTMGQPNDTLGGSKMWDGNVRAAVKVFDDHWNVEIAVPLSALGAEDKLDRWWGLDLVRLSAAISEQSSWSGAGTQLYKSISLGNMFISR